MPMNSPGSVSKTSTPSRAATAAMKSGRATHPYWRPRRRVYVSVQLDERGHVDELDDRGDDHRRERRLGSSSNSPVRNSSVTTVRPAASSPESWVRAPAEPLTAVFDRLPLTTMPLDRPEARLAAPSADQLAVGVDP